jgi:hypothetical protein
MPSTGDMMATAQAIKSGDPAAILATGAGVVAGVGATPALAATFIASEAYRRAFNVDLVDGFRSLFGKDRETLYRKAMQQRARDIGKNQEEVAGLVADWIRENQAVSIGLMTHTFDGGSYRAFMDRLRMWGRFAPSVAWLHLDPRVWFNIDSPDQEEQIQAVEKLLESGLAVVE